MIPELSHNRLLIQRILRKRALLRAHDDRHKDIRPVLVVLGGAMRGVYGAGFVQALHQLDLQDVFDVVVGISTGAAISSYFLAGEEQTRIGSSIYFEECTSKKFINFRRLHRILDIDYLGSVMRTAPKTLDESAIARSRSALYCGVTECDTGAFTLVPAIGAKPDIVQAVLASAAIPYAYHRHIELNGHRYIDGGASNRFPFRLIMEQFQPTDIVVVTLHAKSYLTPPFGSDSMSSLSKVFFRRSPHLRDALRHRNHELLRDLQAMRARTDIHVGAVYSPDRTVKDFTTDARILKVAIDHARDETIRVFSTSSVTTA